MERKAQDICPQSPPRAEAEAAFWRSLIEDITVPEAAKAATAAGHGPPLVGTIAGRTDTQNPQDGPRDEVVACDVPTEALGGDGPPVQQKTD